MHTGAQTSHGSLLGADYSSMLLSGGTPEADGNSRHLAQFQQDGCKPDGISTHLLRLLGRT
jgi:hypothetical protein